MNDSAQKLILYVDNDDWYQQKAEYALNKAGYKSVFCTTGAEALKIISEMDPDLVVVDYNLSDFSGEELYSAYLISKDYTIGKNIPFISMSQNGNVDKSQLYGLGFSGCLSKPFRSKDLIEFIEDSLVSHQLKIEEVQFWETIRESKDFLERVVESSVDAIVTTDTKGFVTYCNQASEELFGYDFDEMIGERISTFLVNGSSELLKVSDLLQRNKKIQDYTCAVASKSKEEIEVDVTVSVMKNGSGQIMGALGIFKRIGGEKTRNGESSNSDRLAAVLETAVAVNHAINNPLVPILGNAQFLLQNEAIDDENIRRRLRIIVNNALRIREITQKLARISHPVNKEYLQGTMMLDIDGST